MIVYAETLMSQDEDSCPKSEKSDTQLCSFIGSEFEILHMILSGRVA